MMNFPDSPVEGSTSWVQGMHYTYTGGVWRATVDPAPTAWPFNYLTNGSFQISQKFGNGASSGMPYTFADTWTFYSNPAAANITFERKDARSVNGSKYRARQTLIVATSTAVPAGNYIGFIQGIEGRRFADFRWGTPAAVPLMCRFNFMGPAGTYYATFRNADGTRSFVHAFTIQNYLNIVTPVYFSVPGDTAGTWVTDQGIGLSFGIITCSGTTYQAPSNRTWANGNFLAGSAISHGWLAGPINTTYFEISDIGIYIDPAGTFQLPPWEVVPVRQALSDTQRYWQRFQVAQGGTANGQPAYQRMAIVLSPSMRVTPAAAIVGSPSAYDQATNPVINGVTSNFCNTQMAEFNFNTTANMTLGRAGVLFADANNYIQLDGRL